jgi:hypothetical protein
MVRISNQQKTKIMEQIIILDFQSGETYVADATNFTNIEDFIDELNKLHDLEISASNCQYMISQKDNSINYL